MQSDAVSKTPSLLVQAVGAASPTETCPHAPAHKEVKPPPSLYDMLPWVLLRKLTAAILPRTASRPRPKRHTCFSILLFAISSAAFAQTYSFHTYTQRDGLSGMTVNCLYQDRMGVIWAGTELGLHRFERDRFEFVGADSGIDSTYIRAITEDASGNLWVASANGLYVLQAGRFRPVLQNGVRVSVDQGNTLSRFGNDVVFVSRAKLFRATESSPRHWDIIPFDLNIPGVATPAIGEAIFYDGSVLWLSCGQRICRHDEQGHTSLLGTANGIPKTHWQAIFRDSKGTLWLRSGQRIVSRTAKSRYFIEHPPSSNGILATFGPTNIVEDGNGNILTHADNGLIRWDGNHWQMLARRPGMEITSLAAPLLIDRNHNLWIGTRGLGIQRWIGYGQIEHWNDSQGLATAPAWSILRTPKGELLVGGNTGSNQLDETTRQMQPWTFADGSPLVQVISMAVASDGSVWLGQSSGQISRRDPGDQVTRMVTQLQGGVRKLQFDTTGKLWIATGRGAYSIQPGSTHAVRAAGLPDGSYYDIVLDHFGRLWATSSVGLYLHVGQQWRQVQIRGETSDTGTGTSYISVAANGEIWLAFDDVGLRRGQLNKQGVLELKRVADPLLDQVMPYFVQHDSHDRLWVGSSQGIDLYQHDHWVRLTQAEGLLWDDISANAFFEDRDGSVWIGSSRGLSRISEPDRLFATSPLTLNILRVRRKLQPVLPGQSLLWSDAPLDIDYSTPGANGANDHISFRYRVKGYQPEWITTGENHLSYPLLASGQFVIEIQALDSRQRAQSAIAQFPLRIFPPWWRSPFALLVYVLSVVAVVLALLRWRTQHLVKRERELQRLVSEQTRKLEIEKHELELARAALAIKASHDDLTGLLNRAGILEAMTAEMAQSGRSNQPLAAVLIDLDHFKQINDQYGHLVGDGVLAQVGSRLNACLRGSDRIGRYGGEELLAILPGLSKHSKARLQMIHDVICLKPYIVGKTMLQVTCSVGVSWYRPEESSKQLLSRADEALYRAKDGGRNRIELEDQ